MVAIKWPRPLPDCHATLRRSRRGKQVIAHLSNAYSRARTCRSDSRAIADDPPAVSATATPYVPLQPGVDRIRAMSRDAKAG